MNSVLVGSIDAVTRRRLVTTRPDVLLPEVARLLSDTPVSLVVVCGPDYAMAGVITKTDIVRKLSEGATRFELSWPMRAMKFHGSAATSWAWVTADPGVIDPMKGVFHAPTR
jgi:predicted transcriptional regulator